MTRILLVHPFAQDISGPDRSILAVIKCLVSEGYHYDVVLPGESPFGPAYEKLGCGLYYYPMSIIKRRLELSFLLRYTWRFFPTIQYLRKIIRQLKPDLVHTNGAVILGGGIAARLERVPSVYHIRCSQIAHPRIVAAIIATIIAWTSQRVIAISQSCAVPMTDRGYEGMTTIIHNGIDMDAFAGPFDQDFWRKEYDLPPGTPIVGQVGRMAPIKGFLEFAQVAAIIRQQVPDAHFVAVGSPFLKSEKAYEQKVRDEVARLGLNNHFHFAGHRQDIPEVMSGFDAFVTMVHEEGFGRVAVEAMACGCPVVANRVDGLCEVVVDGETGYLTGPNSPADAAAKTVSLLRDAGLHKRLSAAARRRAHQEYSSPRCAQLTAEVYQAVLQESRSGTGA